MRWIVIILLLTWVNLSYGQDAAQRCRYIHRFNVEFPLDTVTVIPSTIRINSDDGSIRYQYNLNTGNIFIEWPVPGDSVEVCYQILPFPLHKTYMKRDVAELENEPVIIQKSEDKEEQTQISEQREELFYTENLQKSGSLSRSVSFGNSQNVVVNSNLNLQLEGELTDDVNIRASITDQDVPYQPEGNTAQIQDFDNVFIELYNDHVDLIAGDVVLQNKESHFLRYYKNVQGGLLNLNYKVGENGMANTSFGASSAKGKFASIQLEVEEGVAGPYRIEIPDASRLAIILVNSEKVFLDGKRLTRGFDFDYIIDYDKAEITFTSKVLITQYSRVRMDVEYSDQNYGRGIVAFNHYQKQGKIDFFLNYYSEKDNRNNPLKFPLGNDDKLLLSQIGDSLDLALRDGFSKAEYNPQKIQYVLIDTTTSDSETVRVFKHTTGQDTTLYDVTFTEVGYGNGDYIRSNTLANGVVFQWVSPENGAPRGSYIPAQKIPAPQKKNMANGGISYNMTKYEKVFGEVALSTYDKNLYSELDSEDDKDVAWWVGFESKGRPVSDKIKMNAGVSFERTGRYFNPIDRFRYIEFDRDWNYKPGQSADETEDNILRANIGFEQDVNNQFSYELTGRKRGEIIDGYQHLLNLDKKISRVQVQTDAFLMKNENNQFSSSWYRVNADIFYSSKIFAPGYEYHLDRNEISNIDSDSIVSTEMNYQEHQFYIRNNDTLKTQFRIDYSYREDQLPFQGEMQLSNIAQTVNFSVKHNGKDQRVEALVTYRKSQPENVPGENEETINTRLDWYANAFKNHLRSDLSYAVGSGRELRKEFVFVEVPTGQGTHTWRDDNGNGIRELNEFYLAINADEKNYIKVFVPTTELVFAYLNNFNYRFNAEMPRNWNDAGGVKEFLSRWSNVTSFSSQRKITDPSLKARFFPFGARISDEELISSRYTLATRMFFNRREPRFGFDVGYNKFQNKQLLSGGFEKRDNESWSVNIRSNIKREFSINVQLKNGGTGNSSDFLTGKNYHILNYEINPEFAWQPNVNFRMSTSYTFKNKETSDSEAEGSSQINEAAFQLIYNKAGNLSFNAQTKISNIQFDGEENSPLGYELLEALRPGRNLLWSFVFQKKIMNGLQLSVNYEGRKSAETKVVHIGRMQVSVLF